MQLRRHLLLKSSKPPATHKVRQQHATCTRHKATVRGQQKHMGLLSNQARRGKLSQHASNHVKQGTCTRCCCWEDDEKVQYMSPEARDQHVAQTPALAGPLQPCTAAPHCRCCCCQAAWPKPSSSSSSSPSADKSRSPIWRTIILGFANPFFWPYPGLGQLLPHHCC